MCGENSKGTIEIEEGPQIRPVEEAVIVRPGRGTL